MKKELRSSILFAAMFLATGVLALQDRVAAKPEDATPLKVGAKVPAASVREMDNKVANLEEITKGKPSVIIFYRGGWCPFCNRHLAELATIEADLKSRGYQIIALSPDTPAELTKTLTKEKLSYTLLSDSSADAMKKFGVGFRLDDETFSKYRDQYKIDIERSSGAKHHILPVPSVFVTNAKQEIVFVYSNPDYKVRLKAADILAAATGK